MSRFYRDAVGASLAALALWVSAGCSEQSSTDETSLAEVQSGDRTYPPGTAQVLSVTGPMALPDGEPFETAVNCAAAIRVTTQTISQMPVGVGSREISLLRQAERVYRERAAGAANEDAQESAPAAIEQRLSEVQFSQQSQAQLAMNCIRNLSAS